MLEDGGGPNPNPYPPKTAPSYGSATAGDKIEIIAADPSRLADQRDSSPTAIFLPEGAKG